MSLNLNLNLNLNHNPPSPTSQSQTLRYTTSNPYESLFGYSRAVRRGPLIFVSGTTSLCPTTHQIQHPTSAGLQAHVAFTEALRAVQALGGTREDVVRVRMFVTHQEDTDAVGEAMRDLLGDVGPAATMLVGVQFVSGEMKVEVDAIVL